MADVRNVGGHGAVPVSPLSASGRAGRPAEAVSSSRLGNGIQVLSEHVPGVRSAAVGVWIRQGSAHERPAHRGASHLLEHLVFKGTATRSAREIALALESLGGSLDAYTSREHTSFQARVLDEHLPVALDVLADLVRRPLLQEADLELERQVVLEEISTVEDTPDDLVFEVHGQRLWGEHPYGHSILGTRESVESMAASDLEELHRTRYVGANLVVAAAGNVEHGAFLDEVGALFGDAPAGERADPVAPVRGTAAGDVRVARDTAQSHLVFGTDTPPHADPRRYAMVLLSQALGGGMSSRLFQRVREELALAYAVYTYQSFYSRAGQAGVYVGTRPAWEERAVEAVRREMGEVAAEGLPADELERTREQVKGQVTLSLESTGARLYRLAASALYDEPFLGLDDILARIDAVERDEVAALAARVLDPARQLLVRLGPDGSQGG